MNTANQSIWIDLDNSPHVPLFAPIIRHYRETGREVIVTARRHSQTLELLDLHGFAGTYEVIGKHFGKGKVKKIFGTLDRARQLRVYIRKTGNPVAIAVSHGSRAMVLAASWLKIPVMTMYDYEFTETTVFNRFSNMVLIPEQIPDHALDSIGLPSAKRARYAGIKEEVYVRDFVPDKGFRQKLMENLGAEMPEDKVLVVLRPPADTANYHSEMSGKLFDALLAFLAESRNTFTILVPRTSEQAAAMRKLVDPGSQKKLALLEEAVDGLQLANASDVLISGGGTMNREAVLLGVPVYSIFAGKLGALDAEMERQGSITFIRGENDLAKIKLKRRSNTDRPVLTDRVERFVIDQIDGSLRKYTDKS